MKPPNRSPVAAQIRSPFALKRIARSFASYTSFVEKPVSRLRKTASSVEPRGVGAGMRLEPQPPAARRVTAATRDLKVRVIACLLVTDTAPGGTVSSGKAKEVSGFFQHGSCSPGFPTRARTV